MEIGSRRRSQPAPPHVVFEAPQESDRVPFRPWLTLLDDEQRKLSQVVRDFADSVVAPAAYRYDTERRLPMEIIAQMGELGLFGLPFPRDVGGQGKDYVSLCLAVEALARVDQSIAVTLEAGVGLGIVPIYRHGSREQQER